MALFTTLSPSYRALAVAITLASGPLAPAVLMPAIAHAQATAPTAEEFGRLPAMESLTLSPDGKHMAALTSQDGKAAVITVWSTDDLSKPVGIGIDPRMRFMRVSFVKNERMAVTMRQLLDYGSMRSYVFKTEFTDLKGSKWLKGAPERRAKSEQEELSRALSSARVIDSLPNDPENVLVQGDDGEIYKSNLVTGKFVVQERIGDKDGSLIYNLKGELVAKNGVEFEAGKAYISQKFKNPDTGAWEEIYRAYFKDRELPSIVGLTKDPHVILVSARRGKDHTGIYNFDVRTKQFGEVAFEHPTFDAGGVQIDPRTGDVVAFAYQADRPMYYYVDEKLDSTMKMIEQALGIKTKTSDWKDLATFKPAKIRLYDGPGISLVDWSQDYKTLIIKKSGPATPPEYYLYVEGVGIRPIGAERPWLNTALLGHGDLEQFTARDGRPIPALVYKPNAEKYGKGPYPTLIVPHGGPWARDYLDWNVISPWAQYFVTRGYAVAMPQYRGSDGWGMAQWSAGDSKWGQAMSDDMDDVALGMVAQGVADKNRLAMHGYSFGGYSAMAAVVRPDPIYQCAISGAGPSSPKSMQNRNGDNRFQREFQRPFVGGLDAKANVDKASIPILIYHGDRDTNVIPSESKDFYDALIAAKKKAEYVSFKDMGHESNLWNPEHAAKLLTMVDDFLKKDCKPGGL